MAQITRKPLQKAPKVDVVQAFIAPVVTAEGESEAVATAVDISAPTQTESRPGPGRPRSKRRMEPFSSKIEISLRDELDSHLSASGQTMVDFLDQAIRSTLARK